jgi:hypothetical protein
MTPCIEVDCRDSGAIFKIPYISPTNYLCPTGITRFNYDWGTIFLDVLAQLRTGSGGDTSVDYSLYLHFEDFELAGPTVPQSKGASKRYSAKAINAEDRALSGGKITQGLSLAAKISSSLSVIPVLAPLTEPLSWAARGMAGIASYYGWSKAQLQEIPMPMARQFQRYAAVSDGTDTSYPLALISDNKVQVTSHHALTDEDEMSLKYLCSIPTLISPVSPYSQAYISWTTSQTTNTALLSNYLVAPASFYTQNTKTISTHTATYRMGPPVYYLANLFKQYRGGFKFIIKIAKTEYHSGRLQVCFTPYSASYTAPTTSTATLALREIIDIRCGSEFEIVVPYLLPSNYISVFSEGIGYLDIRVLNELNAPETASSSVDILVYVCAADDFEFQCPYNSSINLAFSPQMDCKQLINEPIGNSNLETLDLTYCESSVGESASSVKQIISRNNPFYLTAFNSGNSGATMSMWPFFSSMTYMTAGTGLLTSAAMGGDVQSYISQMYAFYKGGMRLVVTPGNVTQMSASLINFSIGDSAYNAGSVGALPVTATSYASTAVSTPTGWMGTVQADSNVGSINVNVPYYSECGVSLNTNLNNATSVARTDASQPCSGVNLVAAAGSFSTAPLSMTRSARDDFVFSYFIGCPPRLYSFV